MSKLHKTALGRPIDMAALRAKNETVRAVGNMNVNARGDILDSNNNVIADSNRRVNAMYQKAMQNPPTSKRTQPGPNVKPAEQPPVAVQPPVVPAPVQPPAPQTHSLEPDEIFFSPQDLDDDIPNPEK